MCKPSMFSYWVGGWQTYAAKRGEFRCSGAASSLSGATFRHLLQRRWASAYERPPGRLSPHDSNVGHHFFALASQSELVKNGITSQPAMQLVPAKLIFAGSPAAACKSSDPVDLHNNLSPRRPALPGQCAHRKRSSPQECDEEGTGGFTREVHPLTRSSLGECESSRRGLRVFLRPRRWCTHVEPEQDQWGSRRLYAAGAHDRRDQVL